MVEVNHYIVSMRVILDHRTKGGGVTESAQRITAATLASQPPVPPPPGGTSLRPLGAGTSSSLVSISSNFSSSSKHP
jgi:hypothetical protein